MSYRTTPDIAVLLPCYNEALTIQAVIAQFRAVLPEARIYVFDNNSRDDSALLARQAGAEVIAVPLQGKGNVVRRMFADVEADIYLMADADCTYDASRARELIAPVVAGEVDCVIGTRSGGGSGAYPAGHRFGNALFNLIVGRLFGRGLNDIFSGYRVFSRRFAKSFPAHSQGFEIETELSIFMLEQRIPLREIPTEYGTRPEGSVSKLSTYRDGLRILMTILRLFKESRPLAFFICVAVLLAGVSVWLGLPLVDQWKDSGQVQGVAKSVLSMGLGLLSFLSFLLGMVLDSIARNTRETRHLRYLNTTPRA